MMEKERPKGGVSSNFNNKAQIKVWAKQFLWKWLKSIGVFNRSPGGREGFSIGLSCVLLTF